MRRRDDVEIMRDALGDNLFEQGSVKVVHFEVGFAMSPLDHGDDAVEVTAYVEPHQGRTWELQDVVALSRWVRRLGYDSGIDRYVSFSVGAAR